jgi:peptidoglycan/LPS O-acetylase OafA/YrhL
VHSPAYSAWRTLDWGIPAFVLVCACLGLERYFARWTLLVRLGNHSYSVYLVHPIIWCTAHYIRQTMHPNGYVLVWGSLATIALLGAASYRFLERPAGRLVTRWLLPLGQAARTDNASPEGRAA